MLAIDVSVSWARRRCLSSDFTRFDLGETETMPPGRKPLNGPRKVFQPRKAAAAASTCCTASARSGSRKGF